MPIYSYFPQLFQSITYSRQTTRKLSLSTQLSSEALIAHPTPGTPLNLTLIQPPKHPLTYRPNPTSQAATLTYRSNPTFRAATLTYRPNPISRAATLTYRPEKPAREACAAC